MNDQIEEAERLQRWGYAAFLRAQAGVEAPAPSEPIVEAVTPEPEPEPAPAVEEPAEPPAEE